jgi:hypothetical protein
MNPLPSSPGFPNKTPAPEFRRPGPRSGFKDYLIYGLVLVLVVGLGLGAFYFFTRTDKEQQALRERVGQTTRKLGLVSDSRPEQPTAQLADTKNSRAVNALIDAKEVEAPPPAPSAPSSPSASPPRPAATNSGGTSVHGTGFSVRILPPADPAAPAPSAALVRYGETLRLSAVIQGNPGRAMINGRAYRAGDLLEPELGITLGAVDADRRTLVLRERSGSEVRVGY